jgi:hypothetical protein
MIACVVGYVRLTGAIRNNLTQLASIVRERLAGGPLVRYTPALRLYVDKQRNGPALGRGETVFIYRFAGGGLH